MPATHLARRAIVRVSPQIAGEDATAFLQGLLTNDVTGTGPTYAALLSAQGKTMFDLIVWHDGADVLLDCEADVASDLAKRLSLYRLRRKLDIAVDPTIAVHWQLTGETGQADPRLPALGHRWLASATPGSPPEPPADDNWLAHRLSCGVPEGRAELGDILWLETNAVELNGVSFTKGCYIGQENTARMNWRQKVNRRLIVVPIAQSDEKRQVVAYPELGKAVDHLRIEAIAPEWIPAWMDLTPPAG
ncbi:folate-binding protein [Tsuneonella suprasediminis]|uniref:CAF17-like 4Fe-4S cluster assembly/insertion protein YgfZ n=1 Tax=Tsuneonella suprasediminis TaxID=2306996 RepID=UPI002F95EC78